MGYDEAKDFLYNGDGSIDRELGDKFNALYMAITEDNITDGLNYIKELTSCDDDTAKLLWVDVKCDFGTKENNPILKAKEEAQKKIAAQGNETAIQNLRYAYNAQCPYCYSKNTRKISALSKAGNIALFGVYAVGKIGKQWHCKNCGSDF